MIYNKVEGQVMESSWKTSNKSAMNRQLLMLFEFQQYYWMHIFHFQTTEVCILCSDLDHAKSEAAGMNAYF